MKYVVVLFCLIVAVFSGVSGDYLNKLNSKLSDVAEICIPESKVNKDDIVEIIKTKIPSRMEGKCFISCLQKKFGLQSKDGEPNKNGVLELLEPFQDENPKLYTKFKQIALKCGSKVSELKLKDHCEIAAQIVSCALTEGKGILQDMEIFLG